jgi:hypothetical protein
MAESRAGDVIPSKEHEHFRLTQVRSAITSRAELQITHHPINKLPMLKLALGRAANAIRFI